MAKSQVSSPEAFLQSLLSAEFISAEARALSLLRAPEQALRGLAGEAALSMMAKRQAEAHLPADRWINPLAWTQVWTQAFDRMLEKLFADFLKRPASTWTALVAMTQDPELRRPPTRHWITNDSFFDYLGLTG